MLNWSQIKVIRDWFTRAYHPEYFSTEPEYLNIIL